MAARPGGALPHGQRSSACLSTRGRREPAARRRGGAVPDRQDSGHERAVRGVRARHRPSSTELVAGWRRAAGAGQRARHVRLLARRRRVLRVGRRRGSRARPSGRQRRAAATAASGRGVTCRPTAPGRCSRRGSAGRRSPGSCPRVLRPAGRSTWPATLPSGWRARTSPTPAAWRRHRAARRAGRLVHPRAGRAALLGAPATPGGRHRHVRRLSDRGRSRGGGADLDLDLVDVPGGSCVIGRDPVEPGGEALADELPAGVVELPRVRDLRDTGHERWLRHIHPRDGTSATAALARRRAAGRSRRASRHVGRRRRRGGVLRVAGRPPSDRGRVGEGSAR